MLGKLLAQGRTGELYEWQDGQVLKLFFDWCPQDWAAREILVNRQLLTSDAPVPKLIDVAQIDGRQGLIFERADGPTLLHVARTQPWLLIKVAHLLAELHTRIHKLQVTGLVSVRAQLKATIGSVGQLTRPQKEAIIQKLDQLPDGNTLCHFDFHPDQVILTSKGPLIIDWMTAHRGPPAADVARSSIILSMGRAPVANPLQRALMSVGQGLYHHLYLRRYLTLNPGVSVAQVQAWMVPVAAGRLNENIENEKRRLVRFVVTALDDQ